MTFAEVAGCMFDNRRNPIARQLAQEHCKCSTTAAAAIEAVMTPRIVLEGSSLILYVASTGAPLDREAMPFGCGLECALAAEEALARGVRIGEIEDGGAAEVVEELDAIRHDLCSLEGSTGLTQGQIIALLCNMK